MKFPIYASAGILLTLGSFGSASTASATSRGAVAAPPKFYVEVGVLPHHHPQKLQDVVRATGTGAITGTVRCPWAKAFVLSVVASGNQTFFVQCGKLSSGPNPDLKQTRIFRFRVTTAGRTTAYSPVPGGTFSSRLDDMAASANGAELAVNVSSRTNPLKDKIVMINVKTGARANWTGGVMPGGEIFTGGDLSLTSNGKKLAVFGAARCPKGSAPGTCKSPGEEMRLVSQAPAGGKLASGRMVFRKSQLSNRSEYINDAFIAARGTTVTAAVVGAGLSSFVEVLNVSVATGKPRQAEFKREDSGSSFYYSYVSPDPSGRWVLIDAGSPSRDNRGWIDHGKLVLLKPTRADIFGEAWSS